MARAPKCCMEVAMRPKAKSETSKKKKVIKEITKRRIVGLFSAE